MKDLRGDLSRLQQMNLFDAKTAENQTRQRFLVPSNHSGSFHSHVSQHKQMNSSRSLHMVSRSRRDPDRHSPATNSILPPSMTHGKVFRGNALRQTQAPGAHGLDEPALGSSLSALEQDPRWNSVLKLSQEANGLRNKGEELRPETTLGNALEVESAVADGPDHAQLKVSGAAGFFVDPATGGVKVGKKMVPKPLKAASDGPSKVPEHIKTIAPLPHPSADWVQKHLEIQHELHQEVSKLHAKINELASAPQEFQTALKLRSKTEAQVQALKRSREALAEAALENSTEQSQAAISQVSAQLHNRIKLADELAKKKETWHSIASAAADPHNRTHALRAHAFSDAMGTQVWVEEKKVQQLRQDVLRLQSIAADKERAVEKFTGVASAAGLQKLVQKAKALEQLKLQQHRLEATRQREATAIKGAQVRVQTANASLSRILDHLEAECAKTIQHDAQQNMTLRRAQDALKLLELEQSGLKHALLAEVPGMRKVKKVKHALALVSKARRKQWTQVVGLQAKLAQTRKLSVRVAKMQQLRAEVSTMQSRNKALQRQLKHAARELLTLHEQQDQMKDSVTEDSSLSSAAEKHAIAERASLKQQLRQLQVELMDSGVSSLSSRAAHDKHRRKGEPSLLQQGSWLEAPSLRWRRGILPQVELQNDMRSENEFQDDDAMMPNEEFMPPAEQVPEDQSSDEEAAVQDERAFEDASPDNY